MFKIDIENTSDLNAAIPPLKEVSENKDSKEEAGEAEVKTKDLEQGSQGLEGEDGKSDIPEDATKLEEKAAKTSAPEKDKEKYWSKLKKEREEKAKLTEVRAAIFAAMLRIDADTMCSYSLNQVFR